MDGIGSGHQPVNHTPAINDGKTQGTDKSEGCFGRFKVTVANTVKSFLSSIFSSNPMETSIQARSVQFSQPTQLPTQLATKQTGPDVENAATDKPAAEKNVEQPAKQARHNPETIKKKFDALCSALEQMETCKNVLQKTRRGTDDFMACSIDVQRARAKFNAAVTSFNNAVGADKKIDAADLEMAMANKDAPEFAEDIARYQQMKIPSFMAKN